MLSRVAESIYWMSRYIERAENMARIVDVNEHLMLDLPPGLPPQWAPLVAITGDESAFESRYSAADQDEVSWFLTFDAANPNSILSSLRAARENARSIREILSSAIWVEVNEAYLYVEHQAKIRTAPHHAFLGNVIRASHSVEGATIATMSHAEAYHFSRIGRLTERADQTTRFVDIRYFMLLPSPDEVGSPTDDLHWTAVLQSASALEMYRQRHGMVQMEKTVEFLIVDPDFPRSVRNCVTGANESLHAITGTRPGTYRNAAERRLGRLAAELDYTSIEEVLIDGLHEFLDSVQAKLNGCGAALHDSFFAPRLTTPATAAENAIE